MVDRCNLICHFLQCYCNEKELIINININITMHNDFSREKKNTFVLEWMKFLKEKRHTPDGWWGIILLFHRQTDGRPLQRDVMTFNLKPFIRNISDVICIASHASRGPSQSSQGPSQSSGGPCHARPPKTPAKSPETLVRPLEAPF